MALLSHLSFQGALNGPPVPKLLLESFSFSAFSGSEKLILVKEEEGEGNKTGFG